MIRRRAVRALSAVIGGVFAYAGLIKIQAPGDFAEAIAGFRLLPPALSNLLAMGLPPFEILLGLLLIVGWRRRMATFCALMSSGVFFLALLSAWIRGIPVNCGCFGSTLNALPPDRQLWLSMGRDLLLLAAASTVYASHPVSIPTDSSQTRT